MKALQWILCLTALGACLNVEAVTINVPGDYSSVYVALQHAVSGDVIKIAPGNYKEPKSWRNMPTDVTIEGSGYWNTIIRIDGSSSEGYTSIRAEPGLVLRDFQVWTTTSSTIVVIYTSRNATNVTLDRMVIRAKMGAIYTDPELGTTITNSIIVGGNTIHNLIDFENGPGITMYNNLLMNSAGGLSYPIAHSHFAFYNVTVPIEGGLPIDPTDIILTSNPLNADFTTQAGTPLIDGGRPDLADPFDGTRSDIGCGYAQVSCALGWNPDIPHLPTIGDPPEETFCPGKQFTLYFLDRKEAFPPFNGEVDLQKFIILDVYGSYYFYPRWTTELDYLPLTVTDGYEHSGTIFDFTWPEFDGTAHGIVFWAGIFNPETGSIGGYSALGFGYKADCP